MTQLCRLRQSEGYEACDDKKQDKGRGHQSAPRPATSPRRAGTRTAKLKPPLGSHASVADFYFFLLRRAQVFDQSPVKNLLSFPEFHISRCGMRFT